VTRGKHKEGYLGYVYGRGWVARPFFLQRVRGRYNDGISDDEDLILVNPDLHNCTVLSVCILYRLYRYTYICIKIVSV